MKTFKGHSGRTWSYDPSHTIGDPSGFGVVYLGYDDGGVPVAVKVIAPSGDVRRDRLRDREIDIAKKLQGQPTDHLLKTLDVAYVNDDVLVVMELAETSFASWLSKNRKQMLESEALPFLRDVTAGLRELHQLGIIHRDLSPANILLHDLKWKLADFGIARDTEIGTQDPTFKGWGKPQYMAPELFGWSSPTVKSDLYALGCVAYEALSGRAPFLGPDFQRQHADMVPPPLSDPVNPALQRLVVRLLSKPPATRPQDAREVEEQLARIASIPNLTGPRPVEPT